MAVRVAIIGASGYTGGELMRVLALHEKVEVVAATSINFSGLGDLIRFSGILIALVSP